jgi:pyruvate ferredoxin oxidoreductase gamma subunit
VYYPDVVLVLDPGLINILDPSEGMKKGGILIINTKKGPESAGTIRDQSIKIATVDASKIANEEMGRNIVNTTMIGAFIKVTGLISIEDIQGPLMERFGSKIGARNMKALERAFKEVTIQG